MALVPADGNEWIRTDAGYLLVGRPNGSSFYLPFDASRVGAIGPSMASAAAAAAVAREATRLTLRAPVWGNTSIALSGLPADTAAAVRYDGISGLGYIEGVAVRNPSQANGDQLAAMLNAAITALAAVATVYDPGLPPTPAPAPVAPAPGDAIPSPESNTGGGLFAALIIVALIWRAIKGE